MVGNLVSRRRTSGAVKRDFRTYIRRYTSPNENFEYGYPHSNAHLQFRLKSERCKPCNTARHPTKYDVINDVELLPAVYRRIYCRKLLSLSNQKSLYKIKCIRMAIKLKKKTEKKHTYILFIKLNPIFSHNVTTVTKTYYFEIFFYRNL